MSEVLTEGGLLDGKIRYRQFAAGHRSGFEPVLLAASVAARFGERVLEAGCGAGAGLLCLGHRVPGISGLGVEIEPSLANLANENFKLNQLDDISCVCSDVERLNFENRFDHVFANPPWHGGTSTKSRDRLRAIAHHAPPSLLSNWIEALVDCLKPRGSLTLILPAASSGEAISCLRAAGCGGIRLFPLWPRANKPSKLIIIAARLGIQAADQVLPGLILHDEAGITPDAQAILRGGEAIDLAG